jgi:serine/threonine protein kinase
MPDTATDPKPSIDSPTSSLTRHLPDASASLPATGEPGHAGGGSGDSRGSSASFGANGLPPPGTVIGQYLLGEQLGRGGMGAVVRATDTVLHRTVALKFLTDASGEARERFLREARLAAGLGHPHIVPVHQIGEYGGLPFIVTELMPGGSLSKRVADGGPLPPRVAAGVALQAAKALDFAHRRDIIHRDIKPANLLLDSEGVVRVADFGLARSLKDSSDLTDTGMVVGTAHYLAPEVCAEGPGSPAADIYALGCTLYYLLTGMRPFENESVYRVLMSQVQDPMPDVRQRAPGTPDSLAVIIERACRKEPAERFASAAEMVADLEAALAAMPPDPAPSSATLRDLSMLTVSGKSGHTIPTLPTVPAAGSTGATGTPAASTATTATTATTGGVSVKLRPGANVGSYVVDEPLDEGGLAPVWKARHSGLPERPVALKVSTAPEFADFLRREGPRLARLGHLNVVRLIEYDAEARPAYLAMEYVEGGSLRDRLDRRGGRGPEPMHPAEALRVFAALLEGLAQAHSAGLVHGALSPEAVLMDREDRPRLAGFGHSHTARRFGQAGPGPSLGKLPDDPYADPERPLSGDPDRLADVYACGVLLFEMLTGRPPEGPADRPSLRRPGLAPELDRLYGLCVGRRTGRPADARQLLEAVSALPEHVRVGFSTAAQLRMNPDGPVPAPLDSLPMPDPETVPAALRLRARLASSAAGLGLILLVVWFIGAVFRAWPEGFATEGLAALGMHRPPISAAKDHILSHFYWLAVSATVLGPLMAAGRQRYGSAGYLAATLMGLDVLLAAGMAYWGPFVGLLLTAAGATPALIAAVMQARNDRGFSAPGFLLLAAVGVLLGLSAGDPDRTGPMAQLYSGWVDWNALTANDWWKFVVFGVGCCLLTFLPAAVAAVLDASFLRRGRMQIGLGLCLLASCLLWGPFAGILIPLVPLVVTAGALSAMDLL